MRSTSSGLLMSRQANNQRFCIRDASLISVALVAGLGVSHAKLRRRMPSDSMNHLRGVPRRVRPTPLGDQFCSGMPLSLSRLYARADTGLVPMTLAASDVVLNGFFFIWPAMPAKGQPGD